MTGAHFTITIRLCNRTQTTSSAHWETLTNSLCLTQPSNSILELVAVIYMLNFKTLGWLPAIKIKYYDPNCQSLCEEHRKSFHCFALNSTWPFGKISNDSIRVFIRILHEMDAYEKCAQKWKIVNIEICRVNPALMLRMHFKGMQHSFNYFHQFMQWQYCTKYTASKHTCVIGFWRKEIFLARRNSKIEIISTKRFDDALMCKLLACDTFRKRSNCQLV